MSVTGVVFRRIRGRIIPILSKTANELKSIPAVLKKAPEINGSFGARMSPAGHALIKSEFAKKKQAGIAGLKKLGFASAAGAGLAGVGSLNSKKGKTK